MKIGKLYGVGVGPGDPELITVKAIKTILKADIIAIPESGSDKNIALNIVKEAIENIESKEIIKIDMPMTRSTTVSSKSRENGANIIIDSLNKGKNIAFLTLGDPSIYSTYLYIHKKVLDKGYKVKIIPGVPSFCAVASSLNNGLVEGGEPLHIMPGSYNSVENGLSLKGTKVLMKTGKSINTIKRLLKEKNLYNSAQMVEKCGMDGEKVYKNLDYVKDDSSYFSIIVVKEGE